MQDKELYWKKMYDELEIQMKNMMHMSLELMENYKDDGWEEQYNKLKKENEYLKKQVHSLKLLEHKFNVTILGKITLGYLNSKQKIKNKIKK